ncbi:Abi family protein [Enterococcus hirae]
MTDKPFKTLEEQVEILKQRNLKFKDSENAKYVLMNNSYYGLINRYKEIFSISTQNAEGDFEDDFQGNYFEDLLSIYDFDKNLSSLLYKYFSMIETTLKTSCSYYISLYIGEMQTNYLNKNNYARGYIVEHGKMKGRPSREVTIDHLKKCIKKSGDPSIEYYKKEHNNVPPWISIPALSLGTIYELYRICPKEAKNDISSVFMNPKILDISAQKNLFIKSLKFIHIYRNRVAHEQRIVNHCVEEKNVLPKHEFKLFSKNKKTHMLVKDGRSDSIVGLFLSITILLSSRSLVQSRFIDELESIFVTLKNRNYKAYDLMCRKYMIPKNICSLLRKI